MSRFQNSPKTPSNHGAFDHDERIGIRTAPVEPAGHRQAGRTSGFSPAEPVASAAIAHSLANQGATVAVGYNRDRDSADQFVADMLTKTRHHGASASHTGATSARREIAAARSQEVIDEHGRLVDVLSVVAETGNIGQATYAASKSGLFGRPRRLPRRPPTSWQSPARAPTTESASPSTPSHRPDHHRDDRGHPGKGAGEADQLNPCRSRRQAGGSRPRGVLPCPDASSYITGQVWSVNGGMDM